MKQPYRIPIATIEPQERGSIIRALRRDRNLSLEALGRLIGIGHAETLSLYETGKVIPSLNRFCEIIAALGGEVVIQTPRKIDLAGNNSKREENSKIPAGVAG